MLLRRDLKKLNILGRIIMSIEKSYIKINLSEGSLTIEGSENFIENNSERLLNYVKTYSKVIETITVPPEIRESIQHDSPSIKSIETETQISPVLKKYVSGGIIHIDSDDKSVSILKTVPGRTKAEQIKNIALIVLFAKSGTISGKDLVPICEKHRCYDNKNFSAIFKKDKSYFLRKGTGRNWTLGLSVPGENAAKTLLESMLENGSK